MSEYATGRWGVSSYATKTTIGRTFSTPLPPTLVPVLVTLLAYLPWLLLSRFQPREDALRQSLPWFEFTRDQILLGHLPTWSSARMAGTPHMANIQVGFFYPINWLLLPLPPNVAVQLSLVGHVALAGVLLTLLARRLRLSDFGAAMAGVLFVLGGFATARVFASHLEVLRAMAWVPLIWLSCIELPTTQPRRSGGLLGAATALSLLGGYPAVTAYGLLSGGFLFLWHLPRSRQAVHATLWASLGLVCGVLVCAPALWPLIQLAGQSTRTGANDHLGMGALSPLDLPSLVWPWFYGSGPTGTYWPAPESGQWNWHEAQGAPGLVLLLIAGYGFWLRRRDRSFQALGMIIVLSLLLAFGPLTPAYSLLQTLIPPMKEFRIPERFLMLWALAVPLLAGAGIEALRKEPGDLRRWVGTACRLTVAALVAEGMLVTASLAAHRASLGGSILGLVNIIASLMALGVLRRAARLRVLPACGRSAYLVAAVILELLVVGLPSIYAPSDSLRSVQTAIGAPALQQLRASEGRVLLEPPYYLWANLGDTLNFRTASAYDPLMLSRTASLLRSSQPTTLDPWGAESNNLILTEDGGTAFGVLGVSYLLERRGNMATLLARSGYLPHLSLVPSACTVSSADQSLTAVLSAKFDPRSEVILEGRAPELRSGVRAANARVDVIEEQPGVIRAHIEAPSGGYLVLSESYYPDWRADESDQSVAMVPADHAIMAVKLSPGVHDLTLHFTTPWLLPSMVVAAAGVLGLLCLLLPRSRQRGN